MGRAAFSFSLGFVAGVAGVLAYQNLRRKVGDESAEGLLKDLGEKVRALELRAPDLLGVSERRAVRGSADST